MSVYIYVCMYMYLLTLNVLRWRVGNPHVESSGKWRGHGSLRRFSGGACKDCPAHDLVRCRHTLKKQCPMAWANIPLVVWVPYSYVITAEHVYLSIYLPMYTPIYIYFYFILFIYIYVLKNSFMDILHKNDFILCHQPTFVQSSCLCGLHVKLRCEKITWLRGSEFKTGISEMRNCEKNRKPPNRPIF